MSARNNEPRSVTSARGIRRGDAVVVDAALQEGNLVRIKEPKMLTLVKSPANSVGFKIIREDGAPQEPTKGAPLMSNPSHPVIRRTRRSDPNPVLRLSFPEGTDEATVMESLKLYGLTGYTVAQAEGVFTATRGDLKSISEDATMQIKLNAEGLVATVARAGTATTNPGDKPNIALASVEFDSSKFTLEDVKRWSEEKCVDGDVQQPQNPGECYVVRRSEVPDGEETRRMVLEDGVTAVVVRADTASIPAGYVAIISEAAYGSWGWGQLDFMASLAGRTFNEQMDDSIYTLRNVLDDILLHSSLPLDVRKELANRALAQFGDYVGTVLDSLPRQLLVSVARSANPQQEKEMTKATESGTATNQAVEPKTEPKTEAALTRADIQGMIDAAVAAAAKPAVPAVEPVAIPVAEPAAALTRSDLTTAFTEVVKPLVERLDALEGTTIVRSSPEPEPVKVESKEKTEDVFRGSLPGVAGRRK